MEIGIVLRTITITPSRDQSQWTEWPKNYYKTCNLYKILTVFISNCKLNVLFFTALIFGTNVGMSPSRLKLV